MRRWEKMNKHMLAEAVLHCLRSGAQGCDSCAIRQDKDIRTLNNCLNVYLSELVDEPEAKE